MMHEHPENARADDPVNTGEPEARTDAAAPDQPGISDAARRPAAPPSRVGVAHLAGGRRLALVDVIAIVEAQAAKGDKASQDALEQLKARRAEAEAAGEVLSEIEVHEAPAAPTGSGNTYKHPRIEGNRMRCRVFKSDQGPLRKLTQRIDGRQLLIPQSQIKITGPKSTRQERRFVELEIKRDQKRARKASRGATSAAAQSVGSDDPAK